MSNNLTIGSDYEIHFSLLNPDGSIKDLTGTQELKFAIAKYISDPEPNLLFTLDDPELTITDEVNGKVSLIVKSDTLQDLEPGRVYFIELWHRNALGQAMTLQAQSIFVNDAIIN